MSIDPTTRAAIADLNARFSWALDLHDWGGLREVLAPDVHYVSTGREFHDAESVIASFEARSGARTTRHGLGNLLLSEGPGGTVLGRSSWHTFASNTEPVQGVPLYMVADFHDTYAGDADGSWKLAERIILPVFRDDALAPTTTTGAGR
ncbi:nuclear transport factor 2 family protein [Streptomyces sp. NPDC017991]|uniref:nuclear transport factor 2 family protein n=1 Tax=Streptomyces sp. NPDC017991 TaxID=3365026 RepID=UPI0037A08E23